MQGENDTYLVESNCANPCLILLSIEGVYKNMVKQYTVETGNKKMEDIFARNPTSAVKRFFKIANKKTTLLGELTMVTEKGEDPQFISTEAVIKRYHL